MEHMRIIQATDAKSSVLMGLNGKSACVDRNHCWLLMGLRLNVTLSIITKHVLLYSVSICAAGHSTSVHLCEWIQRLCPKSSIMPYPYIIGIYVWIQCLRKFRLTFLNSKQIWAFHNSIHSQNEVPPSFLWEYPVSPGSTSHYRSWMHLNIVSCWF